MKNTNYAGEEARKIVWRGHVSRLAYERNVREKRGKYRARRHPQKFVDGALHPALRLALPALPLAGRGIPRTPRWRVIIS
jgi:hypothetical protein